MKKIISTDMKKIILILFIIIGVAEARAISLPEDLEYYARVGFSLGGTAPVGMPATIRKLNDYKLQPNLSIAVDAYKRFGESRWGLMAGLHVDNRAMETDADVKNYHMEMRQGGESLEGIFTGNVVTKVSQWFATIPMLATMDVTKNLRLKAGPYFSYQLSGNFDGYAYDGYLRQGDPTGVKVGIGTEEGSRGTYDFSENLRRFYFGIDVGADWYLSRHWGASFDLTWGLNGIFKKDFTTIEQTLFPIYGTVGVVYKLK